MVELYNDDCRNVLKRLRPENVDVIITDFPYANGTPYDCYVDTEENLKRLIRDVWPLFERLRPKVIAFTCGAGNIWLFPKPDWIVGWMNPAGVHRGMFGFNCFYPILVYGDAPVPWDDEELNTDVLVQYQSGKKRHKYHPSSKPVKFWSKVVKKFCPWDGATVLDPMMGTGTTGVCCVKLKKKFIGIELSDVYFKLAQLRIDAALKGLPDDIETHATLELK